MKIQIQEDIKDCSVSIIQALHNHFYHKWIHASEIKQFVNYGSDGVNIENLEICLNQFGIGSESFKVETKDLLESRIKEHFVALIKNNNMFHYVIAKFTDDKVIIWDPQLGQRKLSFDSFAQEFQNVILIVSKNQNKKEHMQKSENKFNIYKFLSKDIKTISFILLGSLVGVILAFSSSLFFKLVFDLVIPSTSFLTFKLIIFVFIFIAITRGLNLGFKNYLKRKLNIKIEYQLIQKYFQKLSKIDFKNINKFSRTDLFRRMSLISDLSAFVSNIFVFLFEETWTFVISLSILIYILPSITGIAILAGLSIWIIAFAFQFLIKSKYEDILNKNMNFISNSFDYISQLDKCKNKHFDSFLYKNLKNSYSQLKENEQKIFTFSLAQTICTEIVNLTTPIILTFFLVKAILQHETSMGTMMFFLGVFSSFISPITSSAEIIVKYPQNKKNMALISSIMNISNENVNDDALEVIISNIKLNNLAIGYDKTLLEIKNLSIDENIIIKGKNAIGKSTFLKTIWTLIPPLNGEIIFNDRKLHNLSKTSIRKQILYISDNNFLPNVSIWEYITLNNLKSQIEFKQNIQKYDLMRIFDYFNLSLNTKIINNGENFSAGQKQIIALMSIFASDWKILLFDEAFENIDEKSFGWLKEILLKKNNRLIIEVSHSNKFISNGKEVLLEKFVAN